MILGGVLVLGAIALARREAYAQARLELRPFTALSEQSRIIRERPFRETELWVFPDAQAFERIAEAELTPELRASLKARALTFAELTAEERSEQRIVLVGRDHSGMRYVRVDAEDRRRLPSRFLERVYQAQIEHEREETTSLIAARSLRIPEPGSPPAELAFFDADVKWSELFGELMNPEQEREFLRSVVGWDALSPVEQERLRFNYPGQNVEAGRYVRISRNVREFLPRELIARIDERLARMGRAEPLAFRAYRAGIVGPSFWVFPDDTRFDQLLQGMLGPERWREFIRTLVRKQALTANEKQRLASEYPGVDLFRTRIARVSDELLPHLPFELLHRIDRARVLPASLPGGGLPVTVRLHTQLAEKYGLTDEQKRALFENIYTIRTSDERSATGGVWKHVLVLNPSLRGRLPPALVRGLVDESLESQQGYQVDLRIVPGDDIDAIAREFAGTRDPAIVARRLRRERRLRWPDAAGEVRIPLESILEPFLRTRLRDPKEGRSSQRYSVEFGPNCFNCGLSSNDGWDFTQEFTSGQDLLARLTREYRFVRSEESLRNGDVMLYLTMDSDQPHHVTRYLKKVEDPSGGPVRELVATKNGMSNLNPYLFSDRESVERTYFGEKGRYRLVVFRRPGMGEGPVVGPKDPVPPVSKFVMYEDGKSPVANARQSIARRWEILQSGKGGEGGAVETLDPAAKLPCLSRELRGRIFERLKQGLSGLMRTK